MSTSAAEAYVLDSALASQLVHFTFDSMRVTVVGTIHEPVGPATADALLAVLRQLQPEVIFLEMPPEALDVYMGGSRTNLEADAVRRYRSEVDVELVAVDLPTPEPEFFGGWDDVRREVRSKSVDYCRLKSWEEQYVLQYGFNYLNSEHMSKLMADLAEVMVSTLAQLGNERLSAHYQAFTRQNESRDNAMLTNIESFCEASSKTFGVLLVGAAHRRSLYEKSMARIAGPSSPITWEFLGTV